MRGVGWWVWLGPICCCNPFVVVWDRGMDMEECISFLCGVRPSAIEEGWGYSRTELYMAGSIWLPSCNTVGRDAAGMV